MLRNSQKKRNGDSENQSDSPAVKRKPTDATYSSDEKVLCKFNDGFYYEAKILRLGEEKGKAGYHIHYQGWNKRYDEFITEDEAKNRFKTHSTEDAKKAVTELKKARQTDKSNTKTPIKPEKVVEKEAPSSSATTTKKRKPEKSSSEVKELKSSIKVQELFSGSITKDLAHILCEENENIVKRQKFPKLPTKTSVEQIIKDFLSSKNIKIDEAFESSIEGMENFMPEDVGLDAKMAVILNLFNISFPHLLVYKEEKSAFDQLLKDESTSQEDASKPKHYSKILGFTHLLRFITRLSEILSGVMDLSTAVLTTFSTSTKELCEYLDTNIKTYYDENDYYGTAA